MGHSVRKFKFNVVAGCA